MGQGPSELRLGNQRTAFWEAGNQSQGSVVNSNLLISLNELNHSGPSDTQISRFLFCPRKQGMGAKAKELA